MKKKIKVLIKNVIKPGEAALLRAQNQPTETTITKLCDAVNFYAFNFKGKEVVAGDKSKETKYLVDKAKKAGAIVAGE